ncbi:FAD-dependent monooxygenase [Arenicella sp.]|nr:FAD-dependent monooxygenase [Arenicella sp.]
MKILVAGAGIGGLCVALCLRKSGHQVQIFEQSKQLSEIGAGLQLGANALRVLDYLGILSSLESVSVAPERVNFCSYKTAQILHSAELGKTYFDKYDAPYLHVHRADLQALLLQALDREILLELNARVINYKQTADAVSLELQDGRQVSGDCLIAADGIKSIFRADFAEVTKAKFTGNVAWRGVIPTDRLPTNFMDKVVTNFVGPNKHMVIYYLRGQQLVNFVGVVEDSAWTDDSWIAKAPWRKLKEDFQGWHSTVQTVIDAMAEQECYRWGLFDQQPLHNWSSRRVTLLGDAAHATLPFLASGAAMAIEDARVLQRALDQSGNIKHGLQVYQGNRLERTAKIQELSAKMGKLYHLKHPVLLKLAFKAIKLKSAQTESFLAAYDPNTEPLY